MYYIDRKHLLKFLVKIQSGFHLYKDINTGGKENHGKTADVDG
jgi:hypothetical protein